MAVADFRKAYGKTISGRFVVSEGVAPSEWMLPHVGLPTWYANNYDEQFEQVILKGTILSVVADANGDSRIVPANGTASAFTWGDGQAPSIDTGATPASGTGTNTDTVTVPARSVPIGCAQFDCARPFNKGTSQGVSWIAQGYVEWPVVAGVNDTLVVGDLVRSDHMGRPVRAVAGDFNGGYGYLQVGKVIAVDRFATNFDDGLLSYMQLPSDPGSLKDVYAMTRPGPYQGKLGIPIHLDRHNAVGAVRVLLTL